MTELRLTDLDEQMLDRLRERAQKAGVTLEERIRSPLMKDVEGETGDSNENVRTLRMPPPDRSFRDVDPVEAPGISASELLIRDRRR